MHGPHVMRGMEFYHGHLIDYSLGNFAGYHALNTGGVLGISGILRVTLARRHVRRPATLVAHLDGRTRGTPDGPRQARHRAGPHAVQEPTSRAPAPTIATDGTITPPSG